MTVNLFGDHPSYERNLKAMRFAFDTVLCLPELGAGNVIAIAFKESLRLDFRVLHKKAVYISSTTELPASSWVKGLKVTQPD